jgi:hypothetical protein
MSRPETDHTMHELSYVLFSYLLETAGSALVRCIRQTIRGSWGRMWLQLQDFGKLAASGSDYSLRRRNAQVIIRARQ